MTKIENSTLLRENRRLKVRIKYLSSLNHALMEELDLSHGECLIKYYDFLEATQQEYGPLLSPKSVVLRGTYSSISGDNDYDKHPVNIRNVVAIAGEGKYKRLYFKQPLYSNEPISGKISSLRVEFNFGKLVDLLDGPHLRLFKLSQSSCINVEHFQFINGSLECVEINKSNLQLKKLEDKFDSNTRDEIKRMQNYLQHMISFRKIHVRSEFGMIYPNE